ncbi:MAG: diguanylate cyclase domain-containing protein, partial [Bacteroidota bacterium]
MEPRRHLASETGLYKYEVFEILLDYEIARIKRYPSPVSLLHMVLAANEYPGELEEQARQALTGLLNRSLRVSDVPCQYQNEYLILLPATDEAGGRAVAERLLASFRTTQSVTIDRRSRRQNAYLGLTSHSGGGLLTAQQLLAEAAVAMNYARQEKSYTYIAYPDIA